MKKLLFIAILLILASCGITTEFFKTSTAYPLVTIDSISTANSIIIPDTSRWITTQYITNDSITYEIKTFYQENKKTKYILTIGKYSNSEIFDVKFRKE